MNRSSALILILIGLGVWTSLPFLMFGIPDAAGFRGVSMIMAQRIGVGAAPIILGAPGLLYKPNRYLAWIMCIVAVSLLMIYGAAD